MHATSDTSLRDDQRLTLRPLARLARRGEARWEVAIGGATRELRGRATDRVLPAIEEALAGGADVATAVVRLAARGVAEEEARGSLQLLYRWEILDDADGYREAAEVTAEETVEETVAAAQERFFSLVSSRPAECQRALRTFRVAVTGAGAAAAVVRAALEASGLARGHAGSGGADLVIHWGPRLGDPACRAVNRVCVERGAALLAAGATASGGWIGPTVLPRESACLECALEAGVEGAAAATLGDAPGARDGGMPRAGSDRVVAHLAALEALRFAAPCLRPGLVGTWQRYDAQRHHLDVVEVVRRPRCRVCGALVDRAPGAAFQVRGEGRRGS